jgi:O-antigen/teichoic acid export membrane protein
MPVMSVTPTPNVAGEGPPSAAGEPQPFEGRVQLRAGESLRGRAARGTIINAAFQVGAAGLDLLRRLIVAAFLTASEFGLWGLLVAGLITLVWLKQIGVNDKYIQQAEDDQETAFQKAFTLELLYTLGFYVLIAGALPGYALLIGQPEIIIPGFVLSLAVLATALQTPNWIWLRRMEYLRHRMLVIVDPVVTFLVTVPLAVAGLGYWSLIIGAVTGAGAGALAAVWASPYRLAIRFDRGTLREYFGFSWPLLVVSGSSLVIVQLSLIVGEAVFGLAGVGIIGLSGAITSYGDRVNGLVTRTIYPAVCAVRDRRELLFESFVKSNRLGLMWAVPFGVGLTLFARDLVEFALGQQWLGAIAVLQAFGLIMAANQVAFNWSAFMRATNDTRPLAVSGVAAMATFVAVGVPLMFGLGIDGYVSAMIAVTAVQLAARTFYLKRLFAGFRLLTHMGRAAAPVVPAVGVVLGLRMLEGAGRGIGVVLAEVALYAAVTVAATIFFERRLLREIMGYLRRPRPAVASPAG